MSRRFLTVLTAASAAVLTAGAFLPVAAADAHRAPSPRDAVQVYSQHLPALATIDGVKIDGSGWGSSWVAKPGSDILFYGLTDRGPNVDGPNGSKIEPLPGFTPSIGEFALVHGRAILLRTIPLRAADGTPFNGQVNSVAGTGETITDLNGTVLPASPYGYDPEGLVAMRDGTFWVSDEYGPFITHFDRWGRQLERLSPYDGTLPAELKNREPNRGMEGLTITPDGRTLVGIMQSGLNTADGPKAKKASAVRIITVDLRTRRTKEYVYLLHHGSEDVSTGVSEISALSNTQFLVDERDGDFEPGANKKLFKIDLTAATDVGPAGTVPGSTYDAEHGGLLVNGQSIEAIAGKKSTVNATTALQDKGIQPVSSSLFVDVAGLVTAIDPSGKFYGHDKLEGVAVLHGGRELVIANDSDFGIDGVTNDAPPFQLHSKTLPDGRQDTLQLLKIDLSRVPAQYRG